MFDLDNRTSYKHLPQWYQIVGAVCEGIPMVVMGNKADLGDKCQVKDKHIRFHQQWNLQYYGVSARTGINGDTTVQCLLAQIAVSTADSIGMYSVDDANMLLQ